MTSSDTPGIALDPVTHAYTLNGTRLVSVTQVLHSVGLIDTSHYTDTGRDRGTLVHQMTEYHDFDDLDLDTLDPALVPYWDAYTRCLREIQPALSWQHIERRLADATLRYAGTVDRIGMWGDDPLVCDIKSGAPESWHTLQTFAYAHLAQVNGLIPSARRVKRAAIYLSGDGTYRVVAHTDTLQDSAVWGAALTVAQWKGLHA